MCSKFYLFEPVTTMVLVSLCSAVHVIRVHAIYDKSRAILGGLGAVLLLQVRPFLSSVYGPPTQRLLCALTSDMGDEKPEQCLSSVVCQLPRDDKTTRRHTALLLIDAMPDPISVFGLIGISYSSRFAASVPCPPLSAQLPWEYATG